MRPDLGPLALDLDAPACLSPRLPASDPRQTHMFVVFALGGWCRTTSVWRLNTLTLSLRAVVLRVLRQDGKGTDAEDAVVQDFIKRTCQVEEELLGEPTRAPCSNRAATACFYTRHQCAHPVYTMAKSW